MARQQLHAGVEIYRLGGLKIYVGVGGKDVGKSRC